MDILSELIICGLVSGKERKIKENATNPVSNYLLNLYLFYINKLLNY